VLVERDDFSLLDAQWVNGHNEANESGVYNLTASRRRFFGEHEEFFQ